MRRYIQIRLRAKAKADVKAQARALRKKEKHKASLVPVIKKKVAKVKNKKSVKRITKNVVRKLRALQRNTLLPVSNKIIIAQRFTIC